MRTLLGALGVVVFALAPGGSHQIRPLGHANPGGGYTGDVFVHKGFAYLSSWHGSACPSQGVRVYNLSKPSRPRHVSTFADGAANLAVRGTWTEKTIVQHAATPSFAGELAAVSFQNCPGTNSYRGFGLYDVTNPRSPKELSLVRTDPGGSHEIWLQTVGRRAYVYTAIPLAEFPGHAPSPGFRIFNATDPRHPVEIGSWIAPDSLREGKRSVFVHSVRVNAAATRAYLSYWDLGTVILDISSPAHPRYLGRTTDTQGSAHSTAITANGKVMIESHEIAGGRPSFWDISNPSHPRLLSIFKPPSRLVAAAKNRGAAGFTLGIHDPKILGTRAYFSWYALGVLVVDISNPRHPRFIAQFLPPASHDPDKQFCPQDSCTYTWGVYPMRSYVAAADMVGGLWTFRPPK
ncbi:MAG TPA: hypothetical protein VKD88_02370 [Gaiellaceae bacterium]|nr:hypothetical protein [Gaiellaceae bacterium]